MLYAYAASPLTLSHDGYATSGGTPTGVYQPSFHSPWPAANDHPHIRAICVAGREYWFDNGEYWINLTSVDDFDEILGFIGGLTNTYKTVAESRHRPLLGHYIVPETEAKVGPKTREIKRVEIVCTSCRKSLQFKPNVGTKDITVNGAISYSEPCPDCGGKMQSKSGVYVFKNGELIEEQD